MGPAEITELRNIGQRCIIHVLNLEINFRKNTSTCIYFLTYLKIYNSENFIWLVSARETFLFFLMIFNSWKKFESFLKKASQLEHFVKTSNLYYFSVKNLFLNVRKSDRSSRVWHGMTSTMRFFIYSIWQSSLKKFFVPESEEK